MNKSLTKHPLQSDYHTLAKEDFYADWLENHLPESWNFNDLILDRLKETGQAFASGALTGQPVHWLFSSETEFRIQDFSMAAEPPKAKPQDHARYIKDAQDVLSKQLIGDPEYDRLIHDRIEELYSFNVRDLILFNIYEDCKDIVEFRFGTQEHGIGYYDNPGVAEIRLRPAPPEQFIANYHRLIESIYENTARMTYIHADIKRNHINFSPNLRIEDQYINLIEQKDIDPAAKDFVRKSFAGILRAFHDGALTSDPDVAQGTLKTDLGTSRGHIFRIGHNRAEYRLGEGDKDHMANYVLKILGGAAYGLTTPGLRLPRIVRVGAFIDKNAKSDEGFSGSFYTARVLQGCALRTNGGLRIPAGYLAMRKGAIEQEMFGTFQRNSFFGSLFAGNSEPNITLLKSLFERVRVLPRGVLDLTDLHNWPDSPKELTEIFNKDTGETSLDLAVQRLEAIDCKAIFTTIASTGYKHKFDEKNWNRHLLDFYNSSANRTIYGDAFIGAFLSAIAPNAFSRSFMIKDKTEPETLSVERTMQQTTAFLAALPPSLAAKIAESFRERMGNIRKGNESGIQTAARIARESPRISDYWQGVYDRRVAISKGFLAELSAQINELADHYNAALARADKTMTIMQPVCA